MNGIVNRTGPHGVSIVRWSGYDCVTISHCGPNEVTTRACPTSAYVDAVCITPDCRHRASTSSSYIAVIPEQESMRTFFSSRGRTGNRETPRDMLRQRLQMRFGVHLIHARIAKYARLQD